jgi:hypothetical protein
MGRMKTVSVPGIGNRNEIFNSSGEARWPMRTDSLWADANETELPARSRICAAPIVQPARILATRLNPGHAAQSQSPESSFPNEEETNIARLSVGEFQNAG